MSSLEATAKTKAESTAKAPSTPIESPTIPSWQSSTWQPKIVAFLCNWCSYTGADLAGISRLAWSPAVRIVRVMCSGRLDPTFVAKAFEKGADGVIVSGCHPGDCHYQEGNYKALRRVQLMQRLLADFGIEPERLRLVWVSASEGREWARIANEMEATIRALGPLRWPS